MRGVLALSIHPALPCSAPRQHPLDLVAQSVLLTCFPPKYHVNVLRICRSSQDYGLQEGDLAIFMSASFCTVTPMFVMQRGSDNIYAYELCNHGIMSTQQAQQGTVGGSVRCSCWAWVRLSCALLHH
jgi:hypothetical protein